MKKGILILSYLLPTIALAEVADKEPSVWTNITVSVVAILLALTLIRIRWWLFPVALLLVAGFHVPILSEIYDSTVGPAIRNELGAFYVWQPQVSALFGIGIIGLYALARRKQRSTI